MDTKAFRHFYDYHFAENRKLWDDYITQLPHEKFTQAVNYSHGSVREQLIHLMSVDEAWFGDLGSVGSSESFSSAAVDDREAIRKHWDSVEQGMRDYLAGLRDEMLLDQPLSGEDEDLFLWQVLLHVVNHGTDHRAQILRVLNDLGVETTYQDYIFYVYGNP